MSNNIMEKAIGNLSDDLIRDAATLNKRKGKIISFYAMGAVAACLTLVLALSLIFSLSKKPAVFIDGEPLMGSSIVLTNGENSNVRTADALPLCVNLELELHKNTEISVSEGSLSLISENSSVYEGESFEAKGNIKVLWTIDNPEENKTYELTLAGETCAEVSFDQGRNVWLVSGQ